METSSQSGVHPHELEMVRLVRRYGASIDYTELQDNVKSIQTSAGSIALRYIGDLSTEPPTQPQTVEFIASERGVKSPDIRDSLRQTAEVIAKRLSFTSASEHQRLMDAKKSGEASIDEIRDNWTEQALCSRENGHLFITSKPHESGDTRLNRIKQAKAICERCPVRDPCLQEALDNGGSTVGVYGGTTEHERRDMLRKISRSRMRGRS